MVGICVNIFSFSSGTILERKYLKTLINQMWIIAYPVFCFSEPSESMLAAISRANACALSCFSFFSSGVILALSEEGSNEKLSTALVTRLVRWL